MVCIIAESVYNLPRKLTFDEVAMLLPGLRLHFYLFHPIIMDTGTIKKLLNGFGFISREGGDDLFFHSADLVDVQFDELQEGDALQFEMGSGPKGPKADKVSRA